MASEYLTPYDELMEASSLGERTVNAEMAQNPLYQRDAAILSGAAPATAIPPTEVSAVTSTAVQPNPFVRPPVPLSTMPVEKQMAWQKQQQDTAIKQAALEKAALDQISAKRKEELDTQGVRQATALLGETGNLKPDDLANYPLQRGELARKYPIGAMSTEAKNILSHYDTIYANALQTQKELMGRQDMASINREAQRREGGEKLAASLGTDVIAKFYQIEKDQGTEAAIQATMGAAADVKKQNIVATLENAGMTPDEIQKQFTGPSGEFLYPAAEARAKVRVNPQQEVARLGNQLTDMYQEKREAGRKWTPAQENALIGTYQLYNQTLNRAGIKLADPNATAIATPTPTPTQGRATPTPTPTARPTATPSPTPPPSPLNPRYEEGWKNGQRYIKMEDGQWHLSKVQ